MNYDYPSLLKRLMAIVYDALLLFGVLFFATLVPLIIAGGPIEHPLFSLYLLGVCYVFFGWFWTHGGQTLGMKAWRLQIINEDGSAIGWGKALVRFLASILSWLILGMGFVWAVFDKRNQTLHDHLSRTLLIKIPKK